MSEEGLDRVEPEAAANDLIVFASVQSHLKKKLTGIAPRTFRHWTFTSAFCLKCNTISTLTDSLLIGGLPVNGSNSFCLRQLFHFALSFKVVKAKLKLTLVPRRRGWKARLLLLTWWEFEVTQHPSNWNWKTKR